jgi:hypothetical protein
MSIPIQQSQLPVNSRLALERRAKLAQACKQAQTNKSKPKATIWSALPGPQSLAYNYAVSDDNPIPADEIFYGGAAGGGKTDLALGLAVTKHKRSLILRREATQLTGIIERSRQIIGANGRLNENTKIWRDLPGGRRIQFGGCQHEADKHNYDGQAKDLLVFDEAPQFSESQVTHISAWARTESKNQHVLVLLTGNPPTTPEGEWIVRRYAAWLDPSHPNPALPGELRWYAMVDGKEVERPDGEPFVHEGETIQPRSRTFIPARVDDNPYYRDSGYKAQLQALPEPLRSQLLYGDFSVGVDDDPWQVIPTEWVRLAQARWTEKYIDTLDAVGVDVARGGKDNTVIAKRTGCYIHPLVVVPGTATPDGPTVAAMVAREVVGHGSPVVNVDVIGVGGSVVDTLRKDYSHISSVGVNAAEGSEKRDKSGKLKFANKRAELYWTFREMLDPASGFDIELPDDRRLFVDLCSAKWSITARGIQVESKEDIHKRIQRSTDFGDAVLLAFADMQAAVQFAGIHVSRATRDGFRRDW